MREFWTFIEFLHIKIDFLAFKNLFQLYGE